MGAGEMSLRCLTELEERESGGTRKGLHDSQNLIALAL